MTNNTNAIATIQFRNKFAKRIQDCSDVLKQKIKEATASFVNDPDNDKCHDLLWLMTYDPAKAVKAFGMELDAPAETATDSEEIKNDSTPQAETANVNEEKAEKPETPATNLRISEDLVSPWRDELRYQRSLKHKDFLKIEVSESCQEAYKSLLNATDAIIAVTGYNACYELCQYSSKEDIERSLYLLASEKEANFFGGIRSLHFGKAAAIALKGYASQLHDLLEAVWNEQLARKNSDVNTPLAAQLNAWRETHSTVSADEADADDAVSEMPLDKVNEFVCNVPSATPEKVSAIPTATAATEKAITAMNITADEAIFEKFLDACKALKDAGYDCTKVVGKMDAIAKILEASKVLNG